MEMYIRFYVAFGMLLLLSHSSRSASQERSAKIARTAVNKYPYLALVTCGDNVGEKCAASIVSDSKVLSYCACAGDAKTKVYAGLVGIADIAKKESYIQVRDVESVVQLPKNDLVKIFSVKNWISSVNVSSITLNLKEESQKLDTGTKCNLVGFGGADGAARAFEEQPICDCKTCKITGDDVLCTTAAATTLLADQDVGGPVICGKMLSGVINMKGKTEGENHCNSFIDISEHRDWIDGHLKPAENGTSGGTGGNGNSTASSGYSIHSYLNKYSNWKVLWFLVPPIVTFLQY